MSKPATPLAHLIPERAFTAQVIELARVLGWRVAHFRPGMTQRGRWITAMSGDVGFPDLVMVRGDRIIFAELKSHKGKLSAKQIEWKKDLLEVAWSILPTDAVMFYEWRPGDFESIEKILR